MAQEKQRVQFMADCSWTALTNKFPCSRVDILASQSPTLRRPQFASQDPLRAYKLQDRFAPLHPLNIHAGKLDFCTESIQLPF